MPNATELVAIGAAVQAAAVLVGDDPVRVAKRWRTTAGTMLDVGPTDVELLASHADVRDRVPVF